MSKYPLSEMLIYHGTSRGCWEQIKLDGVIKSQEPKNRIHSASKGVYFSFSPSKASEFGEIVIGLPYKNLTNPGWTGMSEWQIMDTEDVKIDGYELLTQNFIIGNDNYEFTPDYMIPKIVEKELQQNNERIISIVEGIITFENLNKHNMDWKDVRDELLAIIKGERGE